MIHATAQAVFFMRHGSSSLSADGLACSRLSAQSERFTVVNAIAVRAMLGLEQGRLFAERNNQIEDRFLADSVELLREVDCAECKRQLQQALEEALASIEAPPPITQVAKAD